VETAFDDVPADADSKEIAVRVIQRRDSPRTNNRERSEHSGYEPEAAGERELPQENDCGDDRKQRKPRERSFRQETEPERDVKNKAPVFQLSLVAGGTGRAVSVSEEARPNESASNS